MCLFLRMASSLDAFRTYPCSAWLLCLPCQITDKLEAPNASSSRTIASFLSDTNISSRYHTNCLTHVKSKSFEVAWTIPSSFVCYEGDWRISLAINARLSAFALVSTGVKIYLQFRMLLFSS